MRYISVSSSVFQSALAPVCLTRTEEFGVSNLETLANGCPVNSSDVNSGPREMILSETNRKCEAGVSGCR